MTVTSWLAAERSGADAIGPGADWDPLAAAELAEIGAAAKPAATPAPGAVLARRVSRIGAAKQAAEAVVSCVQNRLRPDHLLQDRSWEQLADLVIVLAEAADPAALRDIVRAPADDGRPDPKSRPQMLRTAHTQAAAYRSMDRPVPTRLAILEREYYRTVKRAQRAPAVREGGASAAA